MNKPAWVTDEDVREWTSWVLANLAEPEVDYREATESLLADHARAQERIGALEAGLEPFRQYALVTDEYTSGHSAPDEVEVLVARSPGLIKTVRVGDFRKARALLEAQDAKPVKRCTGDVWQTIGEPLGNCKLAGGHRGACRLEGPVGFSATLDEVPDDQAD